MPEMFSTSIEVRFADLDLYGHVNNVAFFTYLETARVKLFQDFFREVSGEGLLLVVARAECDYKHPILLHDPVVVTLWVARVGRSSFDLAYRIHDGGGRTFATARTTLVAFAAAAQSVIPLPDRVRTRVEGMARQGSPPSSSEI